MKEDYPRNLVELEARFSTEEACREYLRKLRWPEGFVCPRRGTHSAWASKRNLLLCADCGYQASVTAGTIFQDTRKPLTLWGGLVGDNAKRRGQRAGVAAGLGFG